MSQLPPTTAQSFHQLVITGGPLAGTRINLKYDIVTIGRDPLCQITLDDKKLSREHARIELRDTFPWAVDLDSTNGVYVNGKRISAPCKLEHGDEIRIGSTVMRIKYSGQPLMHSRLRRNLKGGARNVGLFLIGFLVVGVCLLAAMYGLNFYNQTVSQTATVQAGETAVAQGTQSGEAAQQTAAADASSQAKTAQAARKDTDREATSNARSTDRAADSATSQAQHDATATARRADIDHMTATAAAPIVQELGVYGVNSAEGQIIWIHEPFTLIAEGYLESEIKNDYIQLPVEDFVIATTITWDTSTGASGCGFVVRADGNFTAPSDYLFVASRSGNGSVVFNTEIDGLTTYTYVYDADPGFDWRNGGTNRLAIVGRGNRFSIYTNQIRIASFTADELASGLVAMLAATESGRTVCEFSDTWLWVFD